MSLNNDLMIERVAIIGIGLIGGSLALAWKERLPNLHVTGFDKPDVLRQAIQRGVIDHEASSLADAVHGADAVFLAVPLNALEPVLGAIAPHLRPHTLRNRCGIGKATCDQCSGGPPAKQRLFHRRTSHDWI